MKIIFISDMLIFFKFNDEFQNLNVVQEIEKFEFKSAYFLRPHTFEDPPPRLAQETAPRTPSSLTPAEETAPRTVISGPHTMRGDHLSDEKDLV